MSEFLFSNVVDEALSANEEVRAALPVNALSHIVMTLELTRANAIDTPTVLNALSSLDLVEVLFKGSSVVSIDAEDLLAMNLALLGYMPPVQNVIQTTGAIQRVTLLVPFGRKLFDVNEAFPATRRGELFFRAQFGTLHTDFTAYTLRVDTCELMDARPERFLKYARISRTPTATGDHDVDLPLGNKLLGILLFGTTVPSGAVATRSINNVKLLVDSVEKYFNVLEWEGIHSQFGLHGRLLKEDDPHAHTENTAGTYTQNATTATALAEAQSSLYDLYGYLDLDPTKDGQFVLETEGRGRVHLRINAGDTNAIRVYPVELIQVGAER